MTFGGGTLPLAGVKVLEFARAAAGPWAAVLLADLGADVIKVEPPGGDESRHNDSPHEGGIAGYYFGLNRGKRSVLIDLKTSEGLSLALDLAKQSDVLIENYRQGTADKLGIGYSALAKANPSLVYCSISGFGTEGAFSSRPAYDLIAESVTGLMSITGEENGPVGKCGAPITDMICGTMAAFGIVAALYQRAATGQGQLVETSLVGSGLTFLVPFLTAYALGTTFTRLGSAHNTLAPYQAFYGSDGKAFVVACGNDDFWQRLAAAIDRGDLAARSEYRTNELRAQHRQALAQDLQSSFAQAPASNWMRRLQKADVPVAPVYEFEDVINEPQFRVNGYVAEVEAPPIGKIPAVCTPLRFSRADRPVGALTAAPSIDEHGNEIRAARTF
jgi:crotonobetainyl-CoA:carnitine CoA-transferase CaiB-like acyl-CoA transferase